MHCSQTGLHKRRSFGLGLLFLLSFLPLALTLKGTVYRYADGPHVVRDGIVNLEGLDGCVFQVIDYLPVCGTFSSNIKGQGATVDLSEKCSVAMSAYNSTDSTNAVYDISGVVSTTQSVGKGSEVCICGSFTQGGQDSVDLCYWVDGSGFLETWWSLLTDERVASSIQRSSMQKKLPMCKDVDLNKLLEESKANRKDENAGNTGSTGSTPTSSNSGNRSSPSPTSPNQTFKGSSATSSGGVSSTATNSSQPGSNNGVLGSAKIWAPILAACCTILFGAMGWMYKRKNYRRKKEILEKEKMNVHKNTVMA